MRSAPVGARLAFSGAGGDKPRPYVRSESTRSRPRRLRQLAAEVQIRLPRLVEHCRLAFGRQLAADLAVGPLEVLGLEPADAAHAGMLETGVGDLAGDHAT